MFCVRRMEPKDFAFAVALANTMNWNMTIGDFEFNAQLEPDGCFVLLNGEEPIGIATCISYGKIGWFGNLIVTEVYRKHGAGAQLVNHAVAFLKSKGVTTVGLYGYPYLTGFYGALGFEHNMDFVVLKAPIVYVVAQPQGILRVEKQQVSGVVDFDSRCFGGSRRKVLELILGNPDNLCFVASEGEAIVGYVAAKVFGENAEIGPLVCNSNHKGVAVKLLQMVLSQLDGQEAYLYSRGSDLELLDLAHRAGFIEEFRLARMFLGSVVAQNCVYVAESLERG
jgi:GNAT superfamily N-acetyltransferase